MQSISRLIFAAIIYTSLTACGGGGSSSSPQVSDFTQDSINAGSNTNNTASPTPTNPNEPNTGAEPVPGQPYSVAATLSWNEPLLREDGDELSDGEIASYEITYTDPDGEVHTEQISSEQQSWPTTLHEGNYEFAISATDRYGLSSGLSSTIICEINSINSSCE